VVEYPYICQKCKAVKIVKRSMTAKAVAPRCKKCKKAMERDWELNFKLVGRGWPSKELRIAPNDPMI